MIWPRALPFMERHQKDASLRVAEPGHAPEGASEGIEALGRGLVQCYTSGPGLVELSISAPRHTAEATDHPRRTALVLRQASSQGWVANRRQEALALGPLQRALASLLDGRRTMEMLVEALDRSITEERLQGGPGWHGSGVERIELVCHAPQFLAQDAVRVG